MRLPARAGEKRNARGVLIGRYEGWRPLGRVGLGLENHVEINFYVN
jgi:hypothetical protein